MDGIAVLARQSWIGHDSKCPPLSENDGRPLSRSTLSRVLSVTMDSLVGSETVTVNGAAGSATATAGSVTATVGSVTATVTVTVGSVIGREARRVGPGGGWLEDRGREETDDYGSESKLAGRGVLMSC